MKMKKIVAATLVFVLSAGNMVYASAAEPTPGNNTAEILATYNEEEPDPAIVYSVDVEWGSLEYTYDSGKTLTWDPETLKYVETAGTSTWSCEENADKISITNNSNTAITATLSYEQTDSSISGSFDQAKISLRTAEGTEADNGPSGTATLSLSGALSDTVTTKTEIGKVTVTIGEFQGEVADTSVISGTYNIFYTTSEDNVYVSEGQRGAKGYMIGLSGRELNKNYYVPLNGLTIKGTQYYISADSLVRLVSGELREFDLTTDNKEYLFELPRDEVTFGASFHYTITINTETLKGTVLITPVE
ncbi:MAG: hypothetical protein Q4C58_14830 [Eubacteriales bacterium]|nr:hypothetical protein [Eubacteriales bacterium]